MKAGESCPRCSQGHVVKRVNKTNGVSFIGCDEFPKCKFNKNIHLPTRNRGIAVTEGYLDIDEYHEWVLDPSLLEIL